MNTITPIRTLSNRYRSALIWWLIIVRCKYAINALQNSSINLRLAPRTTYRSSVTTDQVRSVLIESAWNCHQIPIGRRPF